MNGQVRMQEPSGCVQGAIVPTGTEKRKFVIYRIINGVNGKVYIGQTVRSVKERFNEHVCRAKKGCEYALHRAICKYGEDNFSIIEVCRCESKMQSDEAEKFYINHFKTKIPNGYNLTAGGDGRLDFSHSKETREKMSKSAMGKEVSKETRAKLSNFFKGRKTGRKDNLGRKHSDEAKAKMSKSLLGNKHMVGFKMPEETKIKISEALRGRKLSEERRVKLIGNKHSLGYKHSEETRAKNSKSHKGLLSGDKHPMFGKHLSDETKFMISRALKGRKLSEETREKISKSKRGRPGKALSEKIKLQISKSLKGQKKSEETRARMSAAMKGRKKTDEHRAKLSMALKAWNAPGKPPISLVK